jgi:hypothetical protein
MRGERGARAHPLVAIVRFVLLGAIPLALGAAAILAGLDRLTGGASADASVALAGGVHALVVVLVGVQDAALRAWTGLPPGDVIARVGSAGGADVLGVFTRLVGAHLAAWAGLTLAADTVRAIFAAGVAVITALALGLSPFRALRSARRGRDDFSRRAWSVGAREGE